LNRWLEQARQAIGPQASSAAWTAGQLLSVAAAVEEAEVEILRLVARGSSNKEIASQLLVSVAAVERHLTNAYTKLGARGRAEATAYITSGRTRFTPDLPRPSL
jgi:DNA-binding NarL/FixJ family response regulator